MMKFIIEPEIFSKFHELNVGTVIVRGMNNGGVSEEIIKSIRVAENEINEKIDLETLSQHPKIDAWRKAYSAFGAKPSEHRCSVENLYRVVLKGAAVRQINKAVDIYNLISLKYILPLGGEDLDKIKGNIKLTIAGPNEPAVLLLGDKEARPPHHGEVIYKDDESAICRRFNWREAERTKLTEETRNAILVAECLPPATNEEIQAVTNELSTLIQKHCGGECISYVLNSENPGIEVS